MIVITYNMLNCFFCVFLFFSTRCGGLWRFMIVITYNMLNCVFLFFQLDVEVYGGL
jgi:hypothetical protein